MDERLEKALDFSNYMITLNNQKRLLKEQYHDNLVYYFNGGQFSVTKDLISFCQSLLALHQTETILVDDSGIPIEIEVLQDFANELVNVYWQSTNKYLTEYNKLKTNRTVESIMDLWQRVYCYSQVIINQLIM